MGNLCTAVLRGIGYILRLIFPRYAAVRLEDYDPISEEHDHSPLCNKSSSSPQNSDPLSIPTYGRYDRVEESEENEDQMSSEEDNTDYIRSIVNNFFEVHNLQKQALTKNITEKFLDLYGKENNLNNVSDANAISKYAREKEIRDSGKFDERNIHHANNKALSSSEKIPKDSTVNQKGKTNALNASLNTEDKENDSYLANKMRNVQTADRGKNKHLTERAGFNMKCFENPEYHRKKYGIVTPEEKDKKEIRENFTSSSRKISSNEHYDDGPKNDLVISTEVAQDQQVSCKNLRSSQTPNLEIPQNGDSDAVYAHEVEVGKNEKFSLRKISLNKLYSGSHYAIVNNDGNIELSDYTKEIPPLQVEDGLCYRKFTHSKLLSGVTVGFQELSDHLSIPNWYEEDPIVCNEVPDGIKVPQSSPVKLHHIEFFKRSTSGGGILSDATDQKVYLPDLFRSFSDPLSQTYLPVVNTQSSTSFGVLQIQTDSNTEIFTDLLNQSVAYDTLLTSKISEEENK